MYLLYLSIEVGKCIFSLTNRLRCSDPQGTPFKSNFKETSAKIMTLPVSDRYSVQHVTLLFIVTAAVKTSIRHVSFLQRLNFPSLGGGFSSVDKSIIYSGCHTYEHCLDCITICMPVIIYIRSSQPDNF